MTAKKLTAEELAVKMEIGNYDWADEAADMLRQQQAEIEALKQIIDAPHESQIDRERDIYATGYWNGIAENKKQYELYGAVWHDEHGYQFTATVGEKVLNDDKWIKLYRKVEK